LIRSAILGTIEHLVTRQVLLGKPENLVELVDPLTELIVGGIKARDGGKHWNLKVVLSESEPQGENKINPKGEGRMAGAPKAKKSLKG
jgi:hypothetical protein